MLDYDDLLEILDTMEYPKGFMEVHEDVEGGRPYLQYLRDEKCSVTGEISRQAGRKWWLSYHMTVGEVVQTMLMAVMAYEEHEVRENFKYKGHNIFTPHWDVDVLAGMRQRGGLSYRKADTRA